jgi:hypothetical protein
VTRWPRSLLRRRRASPRPGETAFNYLVIHLIAPAVCVASKLCSNVGGRRHNSKRTSGRVCDECVTLLEAARPRAYRARSARAATPTPSTSPLPSSITETNLGEAGQATQPCLTRPRPTLPPWR